MSHKKQYTAGFAFSDDREKVALIYKTHPPHLKDKWNGIGGKVESGIDNSKEQAQSREFLEEAGLFIHEDDWTFLKTIEGQMGDIHYYCTFTDINSVKTSTDETVQIHNVKDVLKLPLAEHVAELISLSLNT